jgi:hypothetical protein
MQEATMSTSADPPLGDALPNQTRPEAPATTPANDHKKDEKISEGVLIPIIAAASSVALLAILICGLATFVCMKFRKKGTPGAQQQKSAAAVGPERNGNSDGTQRKSFSGASATEVRQHFPFHGFVVSARCLPFSCSPVL